MRFKVNNNKMKTIKTLLTSIFLMNLSAHGQGIFIGLKVGTNFTNVNSNNFNDKVFKTGLSAGLTFDYQYKNSISLSADLLYSQKGMGNYFLFGDAIGSNGFVSGERELVYFHYDYLSLPVKMGYSFGQTFFGFGNFGLIPSYLVNARIAFADGTSIDETKRVSKFDFAGQIELGFGYKIKDSYMLYTSISYSNSFTYLSNQQYYANGNMINYGITASLGLKYKLKLN
jgi:hypothetical protein